MVARTLGYTVLPHLQLGVSFGIGGSLDKRVLSRTDAFTNILAHVDERSLAYIGLHGGSVSYWIPDNSTWLGVIGAQIGMKQQVGSESYVDVNIAFSTDPMEPHEVAVLTQVGIAWVAGQFP